MNQQRDAEKHNLAVKRWSMGEKVEAYHKKTNAYRVGKIVAVHKSTGLYDVSFTDGGESLDISVDVIRPVGSNYDHRNVPTPSTETYKVGDQVEANREGKDVWRYAVIAKVYPDIGAYDVVYTDRVRENRVPVHFVRGLYASADQVPVSNPNQHDVFAEPAQNTASAADTTLDDVCIGMIVEARYHGGKQYFRGTITRMSRRNNTIDILYEDGDGESYLPIEFVRLIPGTSILSHNTKEEAEDTAADSRGHHNSNEPMFTTGLAVEGNFQGKNRWYPGMVTRVRVLDGGEVRYAVRYMDGDSEENVPEHMLRMPKLRPVNHADQSQPQQSQDANSANASPLKNRRIVASNSAGANRSKGGNKSSDNSNQPNAMTNETTDDEQPARPQSQPSRAHRHHHHHVNDQKKSSSTNKSASKTSGRAIGNGDDDDDDADIGNFGGEADDHEDAVEPVLSTKLAGDLHIAVTPTNRTKKHRHHRHHRHHHHSRESSSNNLTDAENENTNNNNSNNNNGTNSKSNQTSRANSRSTTPMPMERGDVSLQERQVLVRGTNNNASNSSSYNNSNMIVTNTPVRDQRMVPDELAPTPAANNTNTKKKAKSAEPGSAAAAAVPNMQSIRIEANFRGKGVWFPGKLLQERGNGTVDVLYDDGDQELHVPLDRIRPLLGNTPANISATTNNNSNSTEAPAVDNTRNNKNSGDSKANSRGEKKQKSKALMGEYLVNDRVMANYRNQGQYYAGTVKKLHSHGLTVDVVYDDGDLERKIPVDRVYKLDGISMPPVQQQPPPATATAAATTKVSENESYHSNAVKTKSNSAANTANANIIIADLDVGAVVEVLEIMRDNSSDKNHHHNGLWQLGRLLRLYPSQKSADIQLFHASPLTGDELLAMVPWKHVRGVPAATANNSTADMDTANSSSNNNNNNNNKKATPVSAANSARPANNHSNNHNNHNNHSQNNNNADANTTSDLQLQQQLALNIQDVAALREFMRRKDAEIERLQQTVAQLSSLSAATNNANNNGTNHSSSSNNNVSATYNNGSGNEEDPATFGRRTAPAGAMRPGRQVVNNSNNNNLNANYGGEEVAHTPHAPQSAGRPSRTLEHANSTMTTNPTTTNTAANNNNNNNNGNSNNAMHLPTPEQQVAVTQQLMRANEELKRSVAFLGQKFTMVVEELVRVKNHEEKLAKHVKKQGEMLKRLYQKSGHHSSSSHGRHRTSSHEGDQEEENEEM